MPPATHTSSPLTLASIMACRSLLALAHVVPVFEPAPNGLTNDVFGAAIGKAKAPEVNIARSNIDTRAEICRGLKEWEYLFFECRRSWVI